MAGQIKTIRDAVTGKLRKTTPQEKVSLLGKQASQETGLPEPSPFIKAFMNEGVEPQPQPGKPTDPAVAPEIKGVQSKPSPAAPAIEESAGTAGAVAGGAIGGLPGAAAAGAVAAFLAGKAAEAVDKPSPIGTLEGGSATQRNESTQILRDLLSVQQQVLRLGTPTQEPTTNPAGSRL
jgi:hypothetical protein